MFNAVSVCILGAVCLFDMFVCFYMCLGVYIVLCVCACVLSCVMCFIRV